MRPNSDVFSVGQVVALVVAVVTILRAAWLLATLFLVTDDSGTGFVWPFSLDAFDGAISRTRNERKTGKQRLRGNRWPKKNANQGEDKVVCGPLLNYRRIEGAQWFGSVLVVVRGDKPHDFTPILQLGRVGGEAVDTRTNNSQSCGSYSTHEHEESTSSVPGLCLYSDPRIAFWAFELTLDMGETETKWEYTLPDLRKSREPSPKSNKYCFFVPPRGESMRILFYSGNGFNLGIDESEWNGSVLWRDVLRRHAEVPFHVMIGGGNQVYNDGVRVSGPLRVWIDIANPEKRLRYPFPPDLQRDCDDFYLKNYLRSYTTEPYASANCQIPQVNIWDGHDIIRGYGSFTEELMSCDVFHGIGNIAFKYYMLFQHHLPPPPPKTNTTDGTDTDDDERQVTPAANSVEQYEGEFVAPQGPQPGYILGPRLGPYIPERSRHLFTRLGARIALLGIDTRTEVRAVALLLIYLLPQGWRLLT